MNREEKIYELAFYAASCKSKELSQMGRKPNRDDLSDMFIAGALWADTHLKSPWISVEDRLPKPEQEVLLYNSNSIRHYVVGWLRENKGYNKSIWSLNNGYVEDEGITHWMPIVEIVESK